MESFVQKVKIVVLFMKHLSQKSVVILQYQIFKTE
jgi:hypothetical protein